jgi:hypothetical protein
MLDPSVDTIVEVRTMQWKLGFDLLLQIKLMMTVLRKRKSY